jgi:hypothetical protein
MYNDTSRHLGSNRRRRRVTCLGVKFVSATLYPGELTATFDCLSVGGEDTEVLLWGLSLFGKKALLQTNPGDILIIVTISSITEARAGHR